MTEGKEWTRSEVREFDRRLIEELGIPGVVLMENAGRGAADWILSNLEQLGCSTGCRVCVVTGKGNNGGDGYVLARHLSVAGLDVVVLETAMPEHLSPDAGIFRAACSKMSLPMVCVEPDRLSDVVGTVDLWVDALLGTGFQEPLQGGLKALLEAVEINRTSQGACLVALDCPSGMDVDTGAPADGCLRADATLTFVGTKVGFQSPEARSILGEVVVLHLGFPSALWAD